MIQGVKASDFAVVSPSCINAVHENIVRFIKSSARDQQTCRARAHMIASYVYLHIYTNIQQEVSSFAATKAACECDSVATVCGIKQGADLNVEITTCQ
jgi:hypothetical protein